MDYTELRLQLNLLSSLNVKLVDMASILQSGAIQGISLDRGQVDLLLAKMKAVANSLKGTAGDIKAIVQ